MPKQITTGILAHVDAGKTTLSEAMLYQSGSIRKLGRVDNRDTFLDTDERERQRGITIFAKQAFLPFKDMNMVLLDTPGHVDFSAEMERTLQVLDYAILVISGAEGVQGHTHTLWNLLKRYEVPTFIFINKMDQNGTDKQMLLSQLQRQLDTGCVDFTNQESDEFHENIAMCEESLLEHFLENLSIEKEQIRTLISNRKVFPCFFGSALKMTGVLEFMDAICELAIEKKYGENFGARVFKISRDEQGNRLTHMKITGGSLKVKSILENDEKVNQIRIYSGEKFTTVQEAEAGSICTVTGLTKTWPGEGLGAEKENVLPYLEPVLTYALIFPNGEDKLVMLPKLRQLEEECPEMHILWDERLHEIRISVMGEVQIEILKSLIAERFKVEVEFSQGSIVYKETIANKVEGVGHFEPLRHYAEVHLLLEPGERGSGLWFETNCSEDVLSRNWQRLVMTHLAEKEHVGVLTGAPITDMKITLVTGRAHLKHTEGGDFRQATYRALRQGMKKAQSVLLEPYYDFQLILPEQMVGRAMTDIEKMGGSFQAPERNGENAILCGSVPVEQMRNYQKEVTAYTKGLGKLFVSFRGYEPCHNQLEIIEKSGYDSERDLENPTGSVFCAHGAGFVVPWDEVEEHMHLPSVFVEKKENLQPLEAPIRKRESEPIGTEEIDAILNRATHANRRDDRNQRKKIPSKKPSEDYPVIIRRAGKKEGPKEKYLLVDGYNIVFAWQELSELAKVTIDGARDKLLDEMCNYQAIKKCNVIVVFDAYRVKGHKTELFDYHNIHVVFTKEAETADQFIEKFTHENGKTYDITVATSDGLEQIIVTGQGARLLSARELLEDVNLVKEQIRELGVKMEES